MDIFTIVLITIGLVFFEVINSVDNAIINADVLATMDKKYRKWFLFAGMFFAVFVVRGLLPWLIIWLSNPSVGPLGAFQASLSSNPAILNTIEASSPVLLVSAATFLIFLFFHWLFLEPKNFGLYGEEFFLRQGVWFYAVVSLLLASIVWFALHLNPIAAFGAVIGSTAFFITHGFKENAEAAEKV